MESAPAPSVHFELRAFNYATESDNRIHSDEGARRFGFRGGLVPGIADYAYLCRPLLDLRGGEWAETGWMRARFGRPVYDGDLVVVRSVDRAASDEIDLELVDPAGEVCATAAAGWSHSHPAPATGHFPSTPLVATSERPAASLQSLAEGLQLGSLTFDFEPSVLAASWRERWRAAGELPPGQSFHPALYPDLGNRILVANVVLGPWIHVESATHHFAVPHDGEVVSVRARVREAYERKGHELVVLDVAFFGADDRPLALLEHRAIIRPRTRG